MKMKAILHQNYGPPSVAYLGEIDCPSPKDNELLIEVHASTVNRTDAGFRSAEYFVTRFWSGLFKPNNPILGCEFAGKVKQCGKDVIGFVVGDLVFGYNDKTFGGHAEFLTIPFGAAVTKVPKNISIHDAAAITEGAHYALNIIRAANVKVGQEVLVYGASGGIGSAAVQLLKYFDCNVTAVCNTKNVNLVKVLGADVVIDYQQENFTKCNLKFDFIFDAVGKSSFSACKNLYKSEAIYISTELGKKGQNVFLAIYHWFFKAKQRVLFPIPPDFTKNDIEFLKELVEQKWYKPVIDSYHQLDDIVKVYTYVESEKKIGNVILKVMD